MCLVFLVIQLFRDPPIHFKWNEMYICYKRKIILCPLSNAIKWSISCYLCLSDDCEITEYICGCPCACVCLCVYDHVLPILSFVVLYSTSEEYIKQISPNICVIHDLCATISQSPTCRLLPLLVRSLQPQLPNFSIIIYHTIISTCYRASQKLLHRWY